MGIAANEVLHGSAELVRPTGPKARRESIRRSEMTVAYVGVLVFVFVHFAAPAGWSPALAGMPFAKIAGGIALSAFVLGLLGTKNQKPPRIIILLILLFLQLCFAIPFAIWRGGALKIVLSMNGFLGIVLIATATAFAVTTLPRLLRLIFIQTVSVAAMALLSVRQSNYLQVKENLDRLVGIGGMFMDPNDLAIGMAMVVPFCFMWISTTKSVLKKTASIGVLGLLTYGIVMTYSRSGALTFVAVLAMCLWEFGAKQRRFAVPLLVTLSFVAVIVFSPSYQQRVKSIVDPELDATGSRESRKVLLERSIEVTLQNPVFGVGAGNFQVLSGSWNVAHNNYTQLSSESGIPALVIFLLLLRATWSTLKQVQRTSSWPYQAVALGLKGSFVGFVVGGLFWNSVYTFAPYFLFAYAAALGRICENEQAGRLSQIADEGGEGSTSTAHEYAVG